MSAPAASWFSLELGDGLTATVVCGQIEDRFQALHAAAGRPAAMAVFKRHDTEGSLQCEVTAFFSPAAGELAREMGARSCARPARVGLDLLAGSQASWSVLFGERREPATPRTP